jgi:hypothetical protein
LHYSVYKKLAICQNKKTHLVQVNRWLGLMKSVIQSRTNIMFLDIIHCPVFI